MRVAVCSRFAGDPSVPGPGYFAALRRYGAAGEFVGAADPAWALRRYGALLLAGGGDLDPRWWGEALHPLARPGPALRDESELNLTRAFLGAGRRVLGVCRGAQVLAVALGGTVRQHLSTFVDHGDERRGHLVAVLDPTGLPVGSVWVNSAHHQAVGDPGAARVFARAPDGAVEGICYRDLAVGVQWHPERMDGFDALWRWLLGGDGQAKKSMIQ